MESERKEPSEEVDKVHNEVLEVLGEWKEVENRKLVESDDGKGSGELL